MIAASVPAGQFEQAAERARGVGVVVGEREALALAALLVPARACQSYSDACVISGSAASAASTASACVAELGEHGRDCVRRVHAPRGRIGP